MFVKALRPDLKSFYDGKTEWKLGEPMPALGVGSNNGPCGPGYHLGKSAAHAIQYAKFPMSLYEAESCGEVLGEDDTKIRVTSAKILREIKKPSWVIRTEKFIASINAVPWLKNSGKPRKTWRLFETWAAARDAAWAAARAAARDAATDAAWAAAWAAARDAARDAARAAARAAARDATWAAAWDAARDATWAAAWDAALMAQMEIVSDLKMDKKHRRHAEKRWEVWEFGYGLVCDVNGILYCYRKVA